MHAHQAPLEHECFKQPWPSSMHTLPCIARSNQGPINSARIAGDLDRFRVFLQRQEPLAATQKLRAHISLRPPEQNIRMICLSAALSSASSAHQCEYGEASSYPLMRARAPAPSFHGHRLTQHPYTDPPGSSLPHSAQCTYLGTETQLRHLASPASLACNRKGHYRRRGTGRSWLHSHMFATLLLLPLSPFSFPLPIHTPRCSCLGGQDAARPPAWLAVTLPLSKEHCHPVSTPREGCPSLES